MKIALRMLLALSVAFAVAACKSTPEAEETKRKYALIWKKIAP